MILAMVINLCMCIFLGPFGLFERESCDLIGMSAIEGKDVFHFHVKIYITISCFYSPALKN